MHYLSEYMQRIAFTYLYFTTALYAACPIIIVLYTYLFNFLMFGIVYLSLCLLVYVYDVFNWQSDLQLKLSIC